MDRKQTIRELIREFLNMEDTNLNKKEIKSFLKDEMKKIYSMNDEPTEHLLKKWMENEMRTELEEKLAKEFNIDTTYQNEAPGDVVFKLPNLNA